MADIVNNNIEANFELENVEFDAVFEINPSGSAWGDITGNIATQTDLQEALDSKANLTDLPTVNNATISIQKNGSTVESFTLNQATNETINITVPTTASDVGALPNSTNYGASIDLSLNTTDYKLTLTLKDQNGNTLNSKVVDFPIESVVVSGRYDSTNKKIVLTLQNGTTIDIPVGDLVAGLQTEITSTNKLSADLVNDTNTTNKFVTASEKTTWNNKQDALVSGTNIKTINNNSLLGSGNIDIQTGGTVDQTYDATSTNAQSGVAINGAGFATQQWTLEQASGLMVSLQDWVTGQGYITSAALSDYVTNSNLTTILDDYATETWTTQQASALATSLQTWVTSQGYTSNVGTVTSVNNTLPDANGNVTISAGGTVDQTYDGTSANAQSGVAIAGAGFLKNTATATNSLTILGTTNNQNNSILIGYSTTAGSTNSTIIGNTATGGGSYATALGYYARANAQYTTAIGNSSYASYNDTTAIGHNSQATAAGTLAVGSQSKATAQRATSIGYNSQATQYQATALGYEAKATANSALQIGTGTNSTANTLQVGTYTLLDTSTGLIPDARISSNFVTSSSLATTLSNYVQASNGNMTFANAGTEGDILYNDNTTGEYYGVVIGQSSTYGAGVTIGAGNSLAQNGYMLNLSLNGFAVIDASNMGTALLTVSNNNLAVNGSEVVTGDNTRFDGQWVNSSVVLANNVSMTSSTQDYSLSSYLPNDNYDYEVMFNCNITSGTSTGNRIFIAVTTDISSYTEMAYAMPRSNATVTAYGFCILPVGSGRKVTVAGNTTPKGTYQLSVRGYRRIGTNS